MTTLIIRCPNKPFTSGPDSWVNEELVFSYGFLNRNHFQSTSDLKVCPVSEKVIAIMPSIDVRMVLLKLPTISQKKLQQVLPMLLEDELLSQVGNTDIKVLPPFGEHLNDQRIVSIVDQEWLLWISQKLAGLNCEKIQLIPEGILLPTDPTTTFFTHDEHYKICTVRKSTTEIIAWVQPKDDAPLNWGQQNQLKEISWEFLQNSLEVEQKNYAYINLLPRYFSDLRKNNQVEMQHWSSAQLWEVPLKWVKYVVSTMIICYFSYFLFLMWQDRQWQEVLQKSASAVLVSDLSYKNKLTKLVKEECEASHKNNEYCSMDFESLLIQLQKELGNQSQDAIKSIEFNAGVLTVELNRPDLANLQWQNNLIKRMDATHLQVFSYAKSDHE
jgi:Type II secretion system (T2SS), protein L